MLRRIIRSSKSESSLITYLKYFVDSGEQVAENGASRLERSIMVGTVGS